MVPPFLDGDGPASNQVRVMSQASNGDTVRIHYTGKLEDGTVFDTSSGGEPIEFTLGEGQVIPGFEEGVKGMEVGESKTIQIPPEKAYGERSSDLLFEVERDKLPSDMDPDVGDQLALQSSDGQNVAVTVSDISESSVTLDANHPLAGHELTFDVELTEITKSDGQAD